MEYLDKHFFVFENTAHIKTELTNAVWVFINTESINVKLINTEPIKEKSIKAAENHYAPSLRRTLLSNQF